MRADPSRTSFRADPEVNECANLLYETVVTSIEDMILLTCTEKVTCALDRLPRSENCG